MYPSFYVISPQADNPLAVLAKPIEDPDLCLGIIEDCATGWPSLKTTDDELQDPTLPFNLSPDTVIDGDEVECTQRSLPDDEHTLGITPDETQHQKTPKLPTDTPNLATDETSRTPRCPAEQHNPARQPRW